MKFSGLLVISLAAAAILMQGQTAAAAAEGGTNKRPIRIVLPADEPPAPDGQTHPEAAKKKDKATKKTAKKEEPPAKIEGIAIPRGDDGFLGIQIVDSTFKLSFYDADKKPVVADIDRAALRWDPKYKVGTERVVLTPSEDGKSLTSARNIRPPYHFKLFITLVRDATATESPVNETITVDFRQ